MGSYALTLCLFVFSSIFLPMRDASLASVLRSWGHTQGLYIPHCHASVCLLARSAMWLETSTAH